MSEMIEQSSVIIPENPNVLPGELIYLYVPKVTEDAAGIAKFYEENFEVVDGEVKIKDDYIEALCKLANIVYDEDKTIEDVSEEIPTMQSYGRCIKVYRSESEGYGTSFQILTVFDGDESPVMPADANEFIAVRDRSGHIAVPKALKDYQVVPLIQLKEYFNDPSIAKYLNGNLTSGTAINGNDVVNKTYLENNAVTKDKDGNMVVPGNLDIRNDVTIGGNLNINGEINRVNTNVIESDMPLAILNSAVLDGEQEAIWNNAGNIVILSHISGDTYNAFGFIYNKYYEKPMCVKGTYDKSNGKFVADSSVFVPSWDGSFTENSLTVFDSDGNIKASSVTVKNDGNISIPDAVDDSDAVNYKTLKKEVADSLTTVDDRVTFLENTLIEEAEYEVEDTFDTRVTAGGLNIPNKVETEVLSIMCDGEATIEGIKSIGENLLIPPASSIIETSNGITFTHNTDGTITLNGKNNGKGASQYIFVKNTPPTEINMHLERGKYSLRLGQLVAVRKYKANGDSTSVSNSFEIGSGEELHQIFIWLDKGYPTEFNNFVVKPTLIRGSDYPSGYIPYVEDTLTFPKKIKLHSVYHTVFGVGRTISDEIDFVNNTHIQRIDSTKLKDLEFKSGYSLQQEVGDGEDTNALYAETPNMYWRDYDATYYDTPSKLSLINNGSYGFLEEVPEMGEAEHLTLDTFSFEYGYEKRYIKISGEHWGGIDGAGPADDFLHRQFDSLAPEAKRAVINEIVGDSVFYYEIVPTEYYDDESGEYYLEDNYKEINLNTYLEPTETIDTAYVAYRNGTESIIGEGKAKVTQKYIVLRS